MTIVRCHLCPDQCQDRCGYDELERDAPMALRWKVAIVSLFIVSGWAMLIGILALSAWLLGVSP